MTKFILSIDGGGIKGMIPVEFLKELEEWLGKPLHDVFDMVIGTSIGALITALISYQNLSAKEISEIYSTENANMIMPQTCWRRIFGLFESRPKYDGVGKTHIINKYITSSKAKIPSIVPCYNIKQKLPTLYKSYDTNNDIDIRHAVDMSSAAPAYFPAVSANGICGIDGGVFANNPTEIGYIHAMELFPNDTDIRILSIGCGLYEESYKPCSFYKDIGGIQWITSGELLELLMGSPAKMSDQKMKFITNKLGHKYIRINEVIYNHSMDNISEQNIEELRIEGRKWFEIYKDQLKEFFDDGTATHGHGSHVVYNVL